MPTVILVEDDRDLRVMLAGILREHGFTVVAAIDAVEAVASVRGLDGAPELILVDRRMTLGAENELMEWIGSFARLDDVPIVLFTTHGSPAQGASCASLPTDSCCAISS